MHKKIIIALLVPFFTAVFDLTAAADGGDFVCTQLDAKASGDAMKYSLDAEVNGPVFFNDISCGIRYRNKELCAMEMVRFDTSGSVYDYYTTEKVAIDKAYFWLDEKDPAASVTAFRSKEEAEKFSVEKGTGVILDYTSLIERMLK